MDRKIQRTVKKYMRNVKKLEIRDIIDRLQLQGYAVVFFNTADGDEVINAYCLQNEAERLNAFTCCGITNTVFINDKLHVSDKICLLLHETGHILLKHIGNGDINIKDKQKCEFEADAFAHEVLTYKKPDRLLMSLMLLIICICFLLGAAFENYFFERTHIDIASNSNTVYVTKYGNKYHRKDCMYVKDKITTELTYDEAKEKYTPCSVCKP